MGMDGMPDAEEGIYQSNCIETEGWQHCLTVPREVTYKNAMLISIRWEELNGLRMDGISAPAVLMWTRLMDHLIWLLRSKVSRTQDKPLGKPFSLDYQDGNISLALSSESWRRGRKVRKGAYSIR